MWMIRILQQPLILVELLEREGAVDVVKRFVQTHLYLP